MPDALRALRNPSTAHTGDIYIDPGISGLCPTTRITGSAKTTVLPTLFDLNWYEWRTEIGESTNAGGSGV